MGYPLMNGDEIESAPEAKQKEADARRLKEDILHEARVRRMRYKAFIEEGFTEDQAFMLCAQ